MKRKSPTFPDKIFNMKAKDEVLNYIFKNVHVTNVSRNSNGYTLEVSCAHCGRPTRKAPSDLYGTLIKGQTPHCSVACAQSHEKRKSTDWVSGNHNTSHAYAIGGVIGGIKNYEIGLAGEHLICADLILRGHRAFLLPAYHRFDIGFEYKGRLIRVQVKSAADFKSRMRLREKGGVVPSHVEGCYRFKVDYTYAVAHRKTYTEDEIDLFALVGIDTGCIAYVPQPEIKSMMCLVPDNYVVKAGSKIGEKNKFGFYNFDRALDILMPPVKTAKTVCRFSSAYYG